MVSQTLVPRNVTRSTKLREAQLAPELALRSTEFRSPENLIFPVLPEQSIDEYLTKSKGRSSIRQYLKTKPIKSVFKWCFWSAISSGYLYEFYLYLGRKKVVEVNLGESVVMQLSEKLKGTYCTLFLTIFLTGQHWSINFLTMELTP